MHCTDTRAACLCELNSHYSIDGAAPAGPGAAPTGGGGGMGAGGVLVLIIVFGACFALGGYLCGRPERIPPSIASKIKLPRRARTGVQSSTCTTAALASNDSCAPYTAPITVTPGAAP